MASEKITNILEEIKTLSVMELFDLEKAIEDEFGVSAASVAVAAPAGGAAAAAEEQTEFTVMLKSFGDSKMGVIKAVGMHSAWVLRMPRSSLRRHLLPLKENVSKDEADELMKKLDGCGGELEIK